MLINRNGKVWVGRRVPKWAGDRSERMWQMPQGGIDEGEDARTAAFRELKEETGTDKASVIAESREWFHYDLPEEALGIALQGKYRGQSQKWYAMRFEGDDSDIDIEPQPGHRREFDDWKWVDIEALPELVVSFKRPIYEKLVELFREATRQAAG